MKRTLYVEGVHCGGCERRLQNTLKAIEGVEDAMAAKVAVNKDDESRAYAIVALKDDANLTDEAIKAAVEAANFEVISIA